MARCDRENTLLILNGWLEESTKLFVTTTSPSVDVQATFSIEEVTGAGALLKSLAGNVQLLVYLDVPDTEFWYWEPREFSSNREFALLLASLPDADKYRSVMGISFSGRVTGPTVADLLVPLGKVVLMALWD